jgi:RNA polymerase sigma factor (sigma-70 family)
MDFKDWFKESTVADLSRFLREKDYEQFFREIQGRIRDRLIYILSVKGVPKKTWHMFFDDLMQEVLLKLMRMQKGEHPIDPEGKIIGLVQRVVDNTLIDYLRRNKLVFNHISPKYSLDIKPVHTKTKPIYQKVDKEEVEERERQLELLRAAIEKLPENMKGVIKLAYTHGSRSGEERIAKDLGISVWTVRRQIGAAKNRLKELMGAALA